LASSRIQDVLETGSPATELGGTQSANIMDAGSGSFQLAINKRRIEDHLSRLVGDLRLPPRLNLALRGSKFR
jgi:hypothetical protein